MLKKNRTFIFLQSRLLISNFQIMKRILIPIDFSKYSEQALRVAAQIARKNDSEIILLHVLELPNQSIDVFGAGKSIPEIMLYKDLMISKLEELMDGEILKGLEVSEAISLQKVAEGILESSVHNNVDLIVMGTKGTSGLEELLVGSNTEKIVRLSNVPVLVIKNPAEIFELENIVFASDFSKETKVPFEKMVQFASIFQSKISLVTICTPYDFKTTKDAEKTMHDFISDYDVDNYSTHIYNDVTVEKGIVHFAKKIDADLIGLCTYGRTGLDHFFNGSISEELANHAKRPIITFKI